MRGSSLFRIAFLAALVTLWQAPAHAQGAGPTPQQLQTMIANGHESEALGALKTTLRAHPHSGVAWYLVAEAEDASGNLPAGRSALAKAEQYAPGLPFAQPDRVAALRAHLNASGSQIAPRAAPQAAPVHRSGVSPAVYVIGGLVLLFILVRLFVRSRRRVVPPGYPNTYGGGFPGGPGGTPYGTPPPYGPGGATYGRGSGIGGSILGGLAAGAGFAAGERIIEGMEGNRGEQPVDQGFGNDPIAPPDRDDGLSGSPDWGGDQGGGFDDGGGFDADDKW